MSYSHEIYFQGSRIASGFTELPGIMKLVNYVGFFTERQVLNAIADRGEFTQSRGEYSVKVWVGQ